MKKRIFKIVDEFSNVKYKNITRNIFYENVNGYRKICLRKQCRIEKKLYNKYWSLSEFSYNEAVVKAKLHLDYITDREKFGMPLKFHNLKIWKNDKEFILI